MLAASQAAYQRALSTGQSVRFNDRQWGSHEIAQLLDQVKYWQKEVAAEAARAAGYGSRRPIRFNL